MGILLGYAKYLKEENVTLERRVYQHITVYEEVGHGAANIPELDELLAIDMGCIGLTLSCTEEMVSICAKDSSGPYDYDMMLNSAEEIKRMLIASLNTSKQKK